MLATLNDVVQKVRKGYDEYQFSTVYHALNNFCTVDLSSFYMDMAKDILYIDAKNSHARRSIQTVMYDTVVALTKLLSPLLPHTADEVWKYIPGDKAESVQLTDFPEVEQLSDAEQLKENGIKSLNYADDVLKSLETARNEKRIGKSLEAALTIYATDEAKNLLESVGSLENLFIVSKVIVAGAKDTAPESADKYDKLAIEVTKADGDTCERCWVISERIGENEKHPTLCPTCADVVINHYE